MKIKYRTFFFFFLDGTAFTELLPPRRQVAFRTRRFRACWGRSGLRLPISRRARWKGSMRAVGHGGRGRRLRGLFRGELSQVVSDRNVLRRRGENAAVPAGGQAAALKGCRSRTAAGECVCRQRSGVGVGSSSAVSRGLVREGERAGDGARDSSRSCA